MGIDDLTGVVGLDELLTLLFKDVVKGKHRILVSDHTSVGLTTLLKALYDALRAKRKKTIFIEKPYPMKQCLFGVVKQVHENGDLKLVEYRSNRLNESQSWLSLASPVNKLNIDALFSIISRSLQDCSEKYIIIINDVDRITGSHEAYFTTLSRYATLVGATDNNKISKHLRKIWDELKEIKVPLLKDKDIRMIAERFIDKKGLAVEDRELFLTTVVKESRGSPLACANILDEVKGEGKITKRLTRKIRTYVGKKEVDMTPVLFVVAGVFIAMRFISLGLDNPMLYISAGLSYAFFYVLRPFIYKASKRK